MPKKMQIDLFVAFHYPQGKKRMYQNAYVGVMVDTEQGGFEIPNGLSRGMIDVLRNYLGGKLDVKPDMIYIENVIRMDDEQPVPNAKDSAEDTMGKWRGNPEDDPGLSL